MRERLESLAWMLGLGALLLMCLAACVNPGLMAKLDRMEHRQEIAEQRLVRIEARQVTADDPDAMNPWAPFQERRAP